MVPKEVKGPLSKEERKEERKKERKEERKKERRKRRKRRKRKKRVLPPWGLQEHAPAAAWKEVKEKELRGGNDKVCCWLCLLGGVPFQHNIIKYYMNRTNRRTEDESQ